MKITVPWSYGPKLEKEEATQMRKLPICIAIDPSRGTSANKNRNL